MDKAVAYTNNPKTGRKIIVGGPTYLKLQEEGFFVKKSQSKTASKPLQKQTVSYTINPLTNKKIIVGGPTYKKLQVEGVVFSKKTTQGKPPSKVAPDKSITDSHLQKILRLGKAEVVAKGSRGWNDRKPALVSQRKKIYEKCGDGCFLYVGKDKKGARDLKFPICPKCLREVCPCVVDCGGLTAAKVRAAQWKYYKTRDSADEIAKHYGWYHNGKISCQ